ncbi:MAG: V-type ATPase subunit [Oscillospiraceae bacterium]|nr:V-type ATPase subunit [Oscillospiraceae bacterium]
MKEFLQSSTAIYAKCHALYGKALTGEDYSVLAACKTLGDVAAYLKSRTQYAAVLDKLHAPTISRGQLELQLKSHLFHQFIAMCKYDKRLGEKLQRCFLLRGEAQQILSCLRLLNSRHTDDFLLSLPLYFQDYTKIDLLTLAQCISPDEVLKTLEHTEFHKLLAPLLENFNINEIERVFDDFLHRKLLKLLKNDAAVQYLELGRDMKALGICYRLKKYLNASPDEIKTSFSRLTKKQAQALIEAPDEQEFMRVLSETCYSKGFSKGGWLYFEDSAARILYAHALHNFRYTRDGAVCALAYLDLGEIELQNLTHIIEGIRFNAETMEIQRALIQ